ncbi:protein kinase [Epidermidibacterium keratini]|uniref:Protein kinase n=1 Tax=Epidermidibacterium keratini TaxID=1891644 RepID=A0A7L4YRN0_9ACTN|nr:serine/threonine-protein kinase [Epidermidibacterium keratini]QHC01885.1 protein kinase [Epidermidibacterium keratini]
MTTSDRAGLWLPTAADDDDYIGPYRIIREVGAGGMGVVYLGVDPVDRPVAVKVLREHIAGDANARARLRRELSTLEKVRHRCVAGVLDADLEAARPYIVTEFVAGPQLDEYVDAQGPLAREGLVNLGHGLIGALSAIHDMRIVHRDLKPGNILLHERQPVVIDFGIAQLADDVRLTMTGLFVGTPGYVAPEVIYGHSASPATDWWGFAATMVFAATGRSPAGTGPIEVVLDRIRRGELDTRGVDDDLRPLLDQCLLADPQARPSAPEIIERFELYAAGRSTATATPVLAPVEPPTLIQPTERPATAVLAQPTQQPPQRTPPPAKAPRQPDNSKLAKSRTPYVAPPTRGVRRAGTIAAIGLLMIALVASTPLVAVGTLWALLSLARFTDRFTEGLQWRDESRGARRSNFVRELAVSPWSAGAAAVGSAATMLLPGAFGMGTALVAGEVLATTELNIGAVGANVALAAGGAIALPVLWWGPGGTSTRRAVRRSVQVLAPGTYGASILTAAALGGAALLAILMWQFPAVNWWPSSVPPGPFG